jgi:predicted nucleic acid-binding protein
MGVKAAHLLDTSAILAHLLRENGWETVERCIGVDGGRAAVSIISWVEFQLFINRSDYPKSDRNKIIGFYREALGSPLPIDVETGEIALMLKAKAAGRIHLTDLLTAACAKEHAMKLVYRDKHIEGIPEEGLVQVRLPAK